MQSYNEIPDTTTLTASRSLLLNNDKTVMSCSAGTTFPTADTQIGMLCFRTDQNKLYSLIDATPTWKLVMDLSVGWIDNVAKAGGTMSGPLTLSADPTAPLQAATKQYVDSAIPASTVSYFARSTPPAGWLKANGTAISRTAYAALWAAIGTQFGAGDGSTTFNLPDLRGLFIRSWDDGRGADPSRGFGSYQASQNLSHAHGVSDPAHAHGLADPGHAHSAWTDAQGLHQHNYVEPAANGGTAAPGFGWNQFNRSGQVTDAQGSHGHNVGIGASGTGMWVYASGTGIGIYADGGNESRPQNMALLACIKY